MKTSLILVLGLILLATISGCTNKEILQEENNVVEEKETLPGEITDSTNDLIDPNEELDVGEVI